MGIPRIMHIEEVADCQRTVLVREQIHPFGGTLHARLRGVIQFRHGREDRVAQWNG